MFRRFLFSKIWSSAQNHPVLVLLLNLVRIFISIRPLWSGGNVLYHSCTSFEVASRGGQPLNIFTWFIGAGGVTQLRIRLWNTPHDSFVWHTCWFICVTHLLIRYCDTTHDSFVWHASGFVCETHLMIHLCDTPVDSFVWHNSWFTCVTQLMVHLYHPPNESSVWHNSWIICMTHLMNRWCDTPHRSSMWHTSFQSGIPDSSIGFRDSLIPAFRDASICVIWISNILNHSPSHLQWHFSNLESKARRSLLPLLFQWKETYEHRAFHLYIQLWKMSLQVG